MPHFKDSHRREAFKCDLCQFSTAHPGRLMHHMRSLTGEKPLKCDMCQFSAAQKSSLVLHMRTHTGEKPFKCDVCQYSAAWKCSLVRHMRTHKGEKPFKCDVCQFSAARKSNLVRHLITHTKEKPFKCDVCLFWAAQKSTLVNHMYTHIGENLLKNTDQGRNTQNSSLDKKHIDDVNSELQCSGEGRGHLKIDQTLGLDDSVSVQAHLSSDKHQIIDTEEVKIKEESQDDGVQRWIVINSDVKHESDVM